METHPSFLVYNASAGSGKTFTLVVSFLSRALSNPQPDAYKTILAITFTNKAVSEMKSRILEGLRTLSTHKENEGDPILLSEVIKKTHLPAAVIQQRAQKVLKHLLNHYALFSVETIDHFNHRLIRTFAKDLKLSSNFEVSLDTPLLIAEAVDRLLDLAGNDSEITAFLLRFALQKTDEDKSWDIAYDLRNAAQLLTQENDAAALEKYRGKSLADFSKLQAKLISGASELENKIHNRASHMLQLFAENHLERSHFSGGYVFDFFQKMGRGDFNQNFETAWQATLGEKPLYPSRIKGVEAEIMDALLPQVVDAFQEIKGWVFQWFLKKNILKNLVPVASVHLVDEELQKIKQQDNVLPIGEFNRLIHEVIKNQPAPFIYERLGERYRHFFVDEFQDTSLMQWQNLVPLIDNALSQNDPNGQPGSLMIVGDAKQSIYRWRGGLPEQFMNLYENANPFPYIEKKVKNLEINYRSCSEIVGFNNAFFKHLASFFGNPGHSHLYELGSSQHWSQEDFGYVNLKFVSYDTKEEAYGLYPEQVWECVQDLLDRGYTYKDLCVLTRKKDEGIAVSEYLSLQRVPVASEETLLLSHSKAVTLLINLLKLSLMPQNDEAKIEVLAAFHNALNLDIEKHTFFADQLAASLPSMTNWLKKLGIHLDFAETNPMSLYETFEYFISALPWIKEEDAYVMHFMDEVFRASSKKSFGKLLFLDYWELEQEKMNVSGNPAMNAVTVMTIHKSKGLEFPVVLFPFADVELYREIDPKIWYPMEMEGFEEFLIHYSKEICYYGEMGSKLYQQRQETLEMDQMNLLYVACTRPQRELHVFTKLDAPKEVPKTYQDLFRSFLEHKGQWEAQKDVYSFGVKGNAVKISEPQTNAVKIPYVVTAPKEGLLKWLAPELPTKPEPEIAARTFGSLFHEIMAQLKTKKDVASVLELFQEQPSVDKAQFKAISKRIHLLVSHPKLAHLFDDTATVFNEREILTPSGILRPDRINIEAGKKITLIDYKTGRQEPSHITQINSYAKALGEMGFSIKEKLLVYLEDEGIVVNKA
ncbi:MAG TPA: UvrD-helicase domain-containing protein [Flavobacteriaceae bacterium]|nr:UvrD-helicase domain-containing protein [Flavobacteriaceae bacterium]MCB9212008.1 UvrD-helicase domain-containing protein [Alteromonas sp.]HPF09898.1 UvrD-helicase domain-containing protein [Flavobacteriaceae bacterium]HQU19995.1 UvrD-helicase domain-containing protein [Flavobacteriaceae bacterium]HQU64019.1 UvrD-helicase domain-containing protein [Flavobacteriaceae bacterium]